MAHQVWGSASELWLSERTLSVIMMWRRYAVFRQFKREGMGIPVFASTVDAWDAFVDNYQDRQLRKVLAKRFTPVVRASFECFAARRTVCLL
jgi:hypothetical protein